MPRIDVDRSLEPVEIPGSIFNEILNHARETRPEECCGLVFGPGARDYGRVVRCRNDMGRRHAEDPAVFPRDARTAYWMSEKDYLRACEEAAAQDEEVTAVYHSHVGTDAYLSDLDLEYARDPLFPFPGADQIVVAVPEPDAEHLSPRFEDGCAEGIGIFVWQPQLRTFRGHRARLAAP